MNLKKIAWILYELDKYVDTANYYQLYKWVKEINPKTIVETGTKLGHSGVIILKATPNAKFITIDNLQDDTLTKENWGKYLPADVIKIQGDAIKALPPALEQYEPDLVFLDDGHTYEIVSTNLEQCLNAGIKNIIIHDTNNPDIRKAIEETRIKTIFIEDAKGIAFLKNEIQWRDD